MSDIMLSDMWNQMVTFAAIALFVVVCALFLLTQPSYANQAQAVSELDLSRYKGKWFEVARFPNPFQKQCVKNVTAEYLLLENGMIEVINRCEKESGQVDMVKGLAKRQEAGVNSKLGVSFFDIFGFRPVWGDYWVFYVDSDYQLAVVGDRNSKYGWALSRRAKVSASQKEKIKSVFTRNGYDSEKLLFTRHD